jgi:hypothetical protein
MPSKPGAGTDLHCTFQVVWADSRDRYEVHGDDGEVHGFSRDQHTAIGIAQREATQAEREGRVATVCIEQKDGSFRTAPHF